MCTLPVKIIPEMLFHIAQVKGLAFIGESEQGAGGNQVFHCLPGLAGFAEQLFHCVLPQGVDGSDAEDVLLQVAGEGKGGCLRVW